MVLRVGPEPMRLFRMFRSWDPIGKEVIGEVRVIEDKFGRKDFFTLKAQRGDTMFTLDLDFGIKIEPEHTHTTYTEGLLRVEFKRYKPLEHAYVVPIQ